MLEFHIPIIMVFLKGMPCKTNVFFYLELSADYPVSKWISNFPEIKDLDRVYFRATMDTDWNSFLGSIWEFARNGTEIKLIDANQILKRKNAFKKISGLILRGVELGFYGLFEKKWYQSENRMIEKLASLSLVDFWVTSNFDITSIDYQKEKMVKELYKHIVNV